MTKLELSNNIYQKMNPDKFGIDPVMIASIISIIIQIIRLIYDYKNPKQLYDDVNNLGFFRGAWLKYRIGLIIFQSGANIKCGPFLKAFQECLKNKTTLELQNLMGECA